MSEAVFNALLAKSAYIESLTVAKDLVITDGENVPTAGMTGTSSTINTANGETVTKGQGDIRIWAGYPTNNSLYNCPFYVTNEGTLHAKNAIIEGSIIENGTYINKVSFERRRAYNYLEAGRYLGIKVERRLYDVSAGSIVATDNGQNLYNTGNINLNTNHLFVLSEGKYNKTSYDAND